MWQCFLWNSGNFLFPAGPPLMPADARGGGPLEPYTTAFVNDAVARAADELGFISLDVEALAPRPRSPSTSRCWSTPGLPPWSRGDFGWSDIGAWDAVHAVNPTDRMATLFTAGFPR